MIFIEVKLKNKSDVGDKGKYLSQVKLVYQKDDVFEVMYIDDRKESYDRSKYGIEYLLDN